MRLFISINFDRQTVGKIRAVQERLKDFSLRGNFTAEQNLHLTLAFLGEIDYESIPLVETIVGLCGHYAPFLLLFTKTGCFKRGGYRSRSSDDGDLWWIGAENIEPLAAMQKKLSTALWEAGLTTENRAFKPHITLGREVLPRKDFTGADFAADLLPFDAPAGRVSLMKSERSRGKPVYTEIYGRNLEGKND